MDAKVTPVSTRSVGQSAVDAANTAPRLDQLTSLRFFAAFAVLVYHCSFLRAANEPWSSIANTIFDEGYAGVPFFFILSGFILSHTYQRGLTSGQVSAHKYILLRLARILPLHWIVAAVLIEISYNKSTHLWETIANLFLLQDWIPDSKHYTLNGPTWTLSVELFYYCMFIYLCKLSTRVIVVLCSIWVAVICLSAMTTIIVQGTQVNSAMVLWLFLLNPVTRLLDFLVGILTYRTLTHSNNSAHFASEWFSVLLLLIAVGFYGTHKPPEILRYQIVYLPFMAFVIFSFAKGSGPLSALLKHPVLVFMGDASFSLYLVHQPAISYVYAMYVRQGLNFSLLLLFLLIALFCVGLSLIIYKYVENPIHRYLKKTLSKLA